MSWGCRCRRARSATAASPAPTWATRTGWPRWSRRSRSCIEQGAGRDAAVLQNNLAIARFPLEGPASALAALRARDRLLRTARPHRGGSRPRRQPPRTPRRARPHRGGTRAGRRARGSRRSQRRRGHADRPCARSSSPSALERGDIHDAASRADWLLAAARERANADVSVSALAPAAAARLASGQPDQARALLAELDQTPGAHDNPYYATRLPAMVRTALAAGDPDLAQRLADGSNPTSRSTTTRSRQPRPARRTRRRPHPGRQLSTPTRPSAGASSATSPNPPTPCSARAAACVALGQPEAEQPLSEARGTVHVDGLPPRPRRDGSAHRADDGAGLLAAPPFTYRLSRRGVTPCTVWLRAPAG